LDKLATKYDKKIFQTDINRCFRMSTIWSNG